MHTRRRRVVAHLTGIMCTVTIVASSVALASLYRTAFQQQRMRLVETARSQARLMEAVAQHDTDLADRLKNNAISWNHTEATLGQIREAHGQFEGLGDTGEFTLARREGDSIVFLLRQRHSDLDIPEAVPFSSKLAAPMRLALRGESGWTVAADYRGETVLAAYEPVALLKLGIVAKIDLAEIRAPFLRAGAIAAAVTFVLVLVGILLFMHVAGPVVKGLTETESRLRDQFNELEQIYRATPVGLAFVDKDLKYVRINDHLAAIYGRPVSEHIGRTVREVHPELANTLEPLYKRPQETGDPVLQLEVQGTTAADPEHEHTWLASYLPLRSANEGTMLGTIAVIQDVSQLKAVEKSLRYSETRYLKAQELAHVGSWDWEVATGNVKWTPEVYRIFELDPEVFEPTIDSILDRFHADDQNLHEMLLTRIHDSTQPISFEARIVVQDGTIRHLVSTADVERDESGNAVRITGTVHDITERLRAEERVRESERKFRQMFESMNSGIAIYRAVDDGQDFVFEDFNSAAERIENITRNLVLGERVTKIFPGIAKLGLLEVFKRVWHTGQPEDHPVALYEDERLSGWRENHVYRLRSGEIVAIYEDRTEQRRADEEKARLEKQFHQAQKLESIGRLAGGISHDLNNLLSPVIGYSDLLLDDPQLDDTRKKMVEPIALAGIRARDLLQQLLAFSRKQPLQPTVVDINAAVTHFMPLLRGTISEDIAIKMFLAKETRPVKADIGQLEQVIMNLAINAQDAMPQGGTITIETGIAELDADYASGRAGVKPGMYAVLAVSDTGFGIDEETRAHIFEPFYSTKGDAGTGLGLATVYGIIKQHGGNIWVYSEPDTGTTFKIYLPVAEHSAQETRIEPEAPSQLAGTETILIAEDDEGVRELGRMILKQHGYTVLVAENGHEALEILASHNEPVHLLLTDVVMPEMNGRELFEKALQTHSSLKSLYVSGYTDNVIVHRGVLDGGTAFLQKPFNARALVAKVREVLEG